MPDFAALPEGALFEAVNSSTDIALAPVSGLRLTCSKRIGYLRSGGNHRPGVSDIDLATANADDKPVSLFAEDALNAPNGVTLFVQQMADAFQQINVIGAIISPASAAFHGFDLRKPRLPKPQHMLRQIEIIRYFADGAKRIWAFVQNTSPALQTGPACLAKKDRKNGHMILVARQNQTSKTNLFGVESKRKTPSRAINRVHQL